MTAYVQHPLSAAFPSMPGHEIDALAADIKANGQREPAVIFEGQILDGWHRYRACDIAGVPLLVVELPADGDPVAFVKSRNLHRRHLTDSQRAAAAVKCAEWMPRGNPKPETGRGAIKSAPGADLKSGTGAGSPEAPPRAQQTTAQLAAEADVGKRTIEQAKAAERAGLGDAVRDGKVSAKRAAEIAKADPKVGKKIASGKVTADEVIAKAKPLPKILPRPEAGPKKKAKPAPPPAAAECASCAERRARIAELEAELAEALESAADMAAGLEAFMKADEGVQAAAKEIKSLTEQLALANTRRDGLMNTNAELTKSVKHWQRRAEKAEQKLQEAATA